MSNSSKVERKGYCIVRLYSLRVKCENIEISSIAIPTHLTQRGSPTRLFHCTRSYKNRLPTVCVRLLDYRYNTKSSKPAVNDESYPLGSLPLRVVTVVVTAGKGLAHSMGLCACAVSNRPGHAMVRMIEQV